jgi:DNA-binding transcriptional ArsR family regulator
MGKCLDLCVEMFKHIIMKPHFAKEILETWQNVAKVFIALGDEHRQHILLNFDRGERLNVSQIVETSTLSRPAVSHHLKILREAGVLGSVKEGKEVFFWVEKAFLHDALSAVLTYIDEEA